MAPDAGKAWEAKFKADWQKQFPNGAILRLPDQVSGYKHTSRNPCDFVCYAEGVMLLVECKECAEGTLNFSKVPQLDDLISFRGRPGVKPGVLIWFSEKRRVVWVGADELKRMRDLGLKSVSLRKLDAGEFSFVDLTDRVNRVFITGDYAKLLKDGKGVR